MVDASGMVLTPDVWQGLRERETFVGTGVVLSGKLALGRAVQIWHHSTIGFALEKKVEPCKLVRTESGRRKVTTLGDRSIVHPWVLIERGATLGRDVEVMEFSRIGSGTSIGDGTIIEYGAKIYERVHIGKESIVGGFSCNDSKIGNCTTMMGTLVHSYRRNLCAKEWNETKERPKGPVIGDNVLIGFNATVIGDVEVGNDAVVGSGAIVTKSVRKGEKVIMDVSYKN